jgi:sarcosine oxidase
LAEANGATIHRDETVLGFDASDAGVTVTTDRAIHSCAHLIVAAGPWLPELMGRDVARHFKIYRQVLFWFELDGDYAAFAPDRFPVFIWELQGKPQGVYGFPAIDGPRGGIKVSTETFDATTTPQTVERNVTPEAIAALHHDYVAPYLRGIGRRCIRTTTCLYTVTPDFGFVIDRHPHSERVIIASPCSGHGFKHSAAIGEALTQWIVEGQTSIDLSAFRLHRFG